jgi:hypothetical protein
LLNTAGTQNTAVGTDALGLNDSANNNTQPSALLRSKLMTTPEPALQTVTRELALGRSAITLKPITTPPLVLERSTVMTAPEAALLNSTMPSSPVRS